MIEYIQFINAFKSTAVDEQNRRKPIRQPAKSITIPEVTRKNMTKRVGNGAQIISFS